MSANGKANCRTSIILERVDNCGLVRTRSVGNGHDCWGKQEYSDEDYVVIDGKSERVFDGMYVVHDGKDALATGFIDNLDSNLRILLDPEYKKKKLKERREMYEALKEEFKDDN